MLGFILGMLYRILFSVNPLATIIDIWVILVCLILIALIGRDLIIEQTKKEWFKEFKRVFFNC